MAKKDSMITKKDLNDALTNVVTQIIEFVGEQRIEIDAKFDELRAEFKQELYETKVELKNEIRSTTRKHDEKITALENKVFS